MRPLETTLFGYGQYRSFAEKTRCHDGLVLHAADRGPIVMGELVNLKKFKKHIEREKTAGEAQRNRVRFGRTKAQKTIDKKQANNAEQKLDQHRLDEGKQP